MSPAIRKLALTIHLVVSVGWIGAVIAYLALDVAAVAGSDAETMRAALLGMRLVLIWVIVPLAFASLITGLIMSLGTAWGLLRYYWVIFSFILTVFATIVLVQHVPDASALTDPARMAAMGSAHGSDAARAHGSGTPGESSGDFLHAGGGLVVLLVVTVLNIYKPRGMTPYGWRLRHADAQDRGEVRRRPEVGLRH